MDNSQENYKLNSNRWINTLPKINGDNSLNPNKWINTLPKKNENNSFKKYSVITILFIVGLIFVSIVKNETRNIQKEINNLKASIRNLKLEFHQTSLDHEVITSPENITLLAKEHLEINLFPYKKSQIRHLYQKAEIYKKLEWCISNNVISYEMGMGDLTYKKDWSNYIYPFRHHIVYPKRANFNNTLKANLEYIKVSVKEYLFKTFYQKYKNYKESKKSDPEPKVNYKIIEVVTNELPKNKKEINFRENDSYTVLKRLVFDFLYTTSVHKSVVKTFYFPDVNTVLITDEKDNHQVVQFDDDYDLSGKLLITS